jgi:hypothetical protein
MSRPDCTCRPGYVGLDGDCPLHGVTEHSASVKVVSSFRAECSCGWRGLIHTTTGVSEREKEEHLREKVGLGNL